MPDHTKAFSAHDHEMCSVEVLAHAETTCAKRGVRLTPVRRRTLEILAEAHRALGAYDVLERLKADGFGSQPPVAYRALEFLVEQGLVHRVRRLNAFAACMHPGAPHTPAFFICRECDAVAEAQVPEVRTLLTAAAADLGFQTERMNLETLGVCPACAE